MLAYLVGQSLRLIPSLLILVGCVFYVVRGGGVGGFIALVGKTGGVFIALASTACGALYFTGQIPAKTFGGFMTGLSLGSTIMGVVFAIGFFLIVIKQKAGA